MKLNEIKGFGGRKCGLPYLNPHACYREKLDGFRNGAAPKNESTPVYGGYLVSQSSRRKLFISMKV